MSDDNTRCPECQSASIRITRTEDRKPPVRKGQPLPEKAAYRIIWVACQRCKASWSVLKNLD